MQTYGPLISKHLKSLIKNDFKQCVLGRDTPSMNFLIEYNIILKIWIDHNALLALRMGRQCTVIMCRI